MQGLLLFSQFHIRIMELLKWIWLQREHSQQMHREIHTAIAAKPTCNCQQLVLKILSWELNGLDITLEREISAAVTKHEVFPSSSLKIITSGLSKQNLEEGTSS